jgi:trigger factor
VKVSTKRLPESQVLLEIEADEQQMERSLDKAYRRLAGRVEVPGFRKGKVPANMLERHIGRPRIVQEALDILIPEAYNQALEEQDIDAIDQPSIELVNDEPLSFKATVPVRPTVDLGDYEKVRVVREPYEIDESETEKALEELRQRYAIHEPVERPVQQGDIVRADVQGVIDGREVYKEDDAEFRLREGATLLLPGIAEGIVGAEKGSPKEIPVTIPEGDRPLSGKSGTFTVTVREVKQERLPDLTDDFAREVGEGFD